MRSFKKALRLLGFVILMVLASVAVGLGGGVPIPPVKRREDTIEVVVELVEPNEEQEQTNEIDQKS